MKKFPSIGIIGIALFLTAVGMAKAEVVSPTLELVNHDGREWVYKVTSSGPPAVSHIEIGWCVDVASVQVIGTEPFAIEVKPDSLKVETPEAPDEGSFDIIILLGDDAPYVGRTPFSIKAGQNVTTGEVMAPVCEKPTAVTLRTLTAHQVNLFALLSALWGR